MGGVQFLEPSLNPELDRGRLAGFRRLADAQGLYLEVGLPSPNPIRRARELGPAVPASEHAGGADCSLEAVAALDCRHARAYVGDRHDRFRSDVSWPDQVAATLEVLHLLTPRLLELHLTMAIETHADFTTSESARSPGPAGFPCFRRDPGHRQPLDEAGRSPRRGRELAPQVFSTISKTPSWPSLLGAYAGARPVGSGILPMPDMLAPLIRARPDLPLTIKSTPACMTCRSSIGSGFPTFQGSSPRLWPPWSGRQPFASAHLDTLQRPEAVEEIPWASRDLDWLASSLGCLRSVVPTLANL